MAYRPSYQETDVAAQITRNLQDIRAYRSTNANDNLLVTDYLLDVDASGGVRTITLPALDDVRGRTFILCKTDATANFVTLDGDGAETINGQATFSMGTQYDTITIYALPSGNDWRILQ